MIKYINDGLPQSIYNAIVKSANDYDYKGNGISVTRLIDSPYIYWLSKNHDVEVLASKSLWSLFGTMMHEILSRNSNLITEVRFATIVDGVELTGKLDVYDPGPAFIEDYKFLGWQSKKMEPEGKLEYRLQLNVLAYILIKNHFKVNGLKLHYLYRNLSEFDLLKHDTPDKMIETIEVPIMPDIESYIKKRIALYKDVVLYNKMPDVCTLSERWGSRKWAVVKKGNTKATKLYETYDEAIDDCNQRGSAYEVQERLNDFVRCKAYCSYNSVCRFYQANKYKTNQEED